MPLLVLIIFLCIGTILGYTPTDPFYCRLSWLQSPGIALGLYLQGNNTVDANSRNLGIMGFQCTSVHLSPNELYCERNRSDDNQIKLIWKNEQESTNTPALFRLANFPSGMESYAEIQQQFNRGYSCNTAGKDWTLSSGTTILSGSYCEFESDHVKFNCRQRQQASIAL